MVLLKMLYLDIGCSNHTTGDKTMFVELDENVMSQVKMGNDNHTEVQGKGIVSVSTETCNKFIPNVMYVPSLAQNLMSLGQLMEKGYYAIF